MIWLIYHRVAAASRWSMINDDNNNKKGESDMRGVCVFVGVLLAIRRRSVNCRAECTSLFHCFFMLNHSIYEVKRWLDCLAFCNIRVCSNSSSLLLNFS